MTGWRPTRWRNPAGWYAAAGMLLLGLSLFVPWLSALRTTRIERRADGIVAALCDAAAAFEAPLTEPDLDAVYARFVMLASARGEYTKDLERIEPPPDGALLCVRSRHYAFQLAASPPAANQQPGRDTVDALEAVAWPLSTVGPGHCVFFYADNAARAYSRNLRRGYAGFDDDLRPKPGSGQRGPGLGSRRESQYSGTDNARWILY